MSNLNILISGSGIAGGVFAFWLANVTIVERDASLRLTGASVDTRSSAVDISKWMGIEQEIRNQTTKEEGIQFVKANGKAVAIQMAVRRYEEIMLPFAKNSQGGDNAMQLLNPQTPWGITIRNAILAFVTWPRLDRLAIAVASALGFTEKKVAPSYSRNIHSFLASLVIMEGSR